ncbi:MAG: L,D-transpeptidase [Pseudomonadota bacterium]
MPVTDTDKSRSLHLAEPLAAAAMFLALAFGSGAGNVTAQGVHIPPTLQAEDILKAGAKIYPDIKIEVNIPAMEMIVYENGAPIMVNPVAIGSGVYPTPEQESEIKKIEWNPWWYPPPNAPWARGAKPTPPGPGNPLGRVKMPMSDAILFHGTNKDYSVGRPVSHGCMRMHNTDAAELGWFLQSRFSERTDPALRGVYRKNGGTTYVVQLEAPVPVRLVYKPVIFRSGALFIYPDFYHKLPQKKAAVMDALASGGVGIDSIDEGKVDDIVKRWPAKAKRVSIDSLMRDAMAEEPNPSSNL